MPPRRAPQPAPPPFAPAPEPAAFRDLLIFEERLKQNAARLIRRRRKYGGECGQARERQRGSKEGPRW